MSLKKKEKKRKIKKYLIVLIIFREIVPIKLDFQYVNDILQQHSTCIVSGDHGFDKVHVFMMPDRMIHTSFSQDFGPFVIDFIKLDFFKSTFEFVTHLIDILQSLHGKKGMNGWFESFLFMNGFQDSYHPEFFPIMLGYFLLNYLFI